MLSFVPEEGLRLMRPNIAQPLDAGFRFGFIRASLAGASDAQRWAGVAEKGWFSGRFLVSLTRAQKVLAVLHGRAYETGRMERTREGRPNEASAVDDGVPSLFQTARHLAPPPLTPIVI
jgi:hypothetical protein